MMVGGVVGVVIIRYGVSIDIAVFVVYRANERNCDGQ